MKSSFENCIRCTICVENCPVFKVNPEYPGPKQAGPDAERFRLDGIETVDKWITHCTQCKRCDYSCPYGVDPSKLILNAQIHYVRENRKTLPQILFSNFHYIARLGSLFSVITNFITSLGIARKLFNLTGLRSDIPFPLFKFRTLQRFRKKEVRTPYSSASLITDWTEVSETDEISTDNKNTEKPAPVDHIKINRPKKRKAAFFHGCYLNSNAPDEGRMIIAILEHFGVQVAIPDQVCCGLPALGNGDLVKAKGFAKKNSKEFAKYVNEGWDILYSCTSCGHTLIYDYPEILDTDEGDLISKNTWNLYEYLLLIKDEGRVHFDFKPFKKKISYHIPCHLRGRGVPYPAVKIFNEIPGLELYIQDENCCGFSGSYGFKEKNKETTDTLGRIAVESLMEPGPDVIISDCGACRMQISNFTGTNMMDPIQVMFEALGL
jgi:glycerol-3-phosphate dehydrogenase subunit C